MVIRYQFNTIYFSILMSVFLLISWLILFINKKLFQQMTKNEVLDFLSIKYITASFMATYFSGIVHPLDLIKTRFQSHDGRSSSENLVPKYNGIKSAIKKIYKDEGIKGLYKGFYISLLCQASSMSMFFWIYETRKTAYEKKGNDTMRAVALSSTQASIITTLITQPIWVVKTRMLLNIDQNISQLENCKKNVRQIYSQHGFKGFLKGLQLSLILSFTGVIQMYSYQYAKIFYDRLSIPESPLSQKSFICGSFSKFFSVFLSYPITTIRTRIQQNQFVNGSQKKYMGLSDVVRRLIIQEGIAGLYKGMGANLMRGVFQKGIYFYCYQYLKVQLFKRREEIC